MKQKAFLEPVEEAGRRCRCDYTDDDPSAVKILKAAVTMATAAVKIHLKCCGTILVERNDCVQGGLG